MLKRIISVIVIVLIGTPITHLVLYLLSVAAGNIASPTQYGVTTLQSAWHDYSATLPRVIGNTYMFPGLEIGIWSGIIERTIRSFGLLSIAAVCAIVGGIWLGKQVSQTLNSQLPRWFVVLASTGNTLQSLFVASGGVAIMYFVMVYTPYSNPLPLNGFGWDTHLVLPVLALMLRPLVSIAHDTATFIGEASQQPHIIATQARGFSNTHIINRHIWPAQQMTIGLISADNLRQMIAELMVVEIIFGWGGIGESIVRAIIPPKMTNIPAGTLYLDAHAFAAMGVVIFGMFGVIEILRIVGTPRHVQVLDEEQRA